MPVNSRPQALTAKQLAFCQTYASTGHNGAAAALAAGYSPRTCRITASENLKKPNIIQKIAELEAPAKQAIQAEICYTAKKALEEYDEVHQLALRQERKGEPSPDLAAALKAIEGKCRLAGLYEKESQPQQDVVIHIRTTAGGDL